MSGHNHLLAGHFTPGREPQYTGESVGPRVGLDDLRKRKIPCPSRDTNPRLSSPSHSHYTDWAILAPLLLLLVVRLSCKNCCSNKYIRHTISYHEPRLKSTYHDGVHSKSDYNFIEANMATMISAQWWQTTITEKIVNSILVWFPCL